MGTGLVSKPELPAMWWYGMHIPTLVKIKEIINSDEYLSKNIAALEGLSLVNEIIDRYIKLSKKIEVAELALLAGELK